MPALIAVARSLLMALIQTGIFIGAEKIISGLVDKIKNRHKDEYGLDDADAQAATENIFIDILIYAGITFALIKGKIPAKLADKLGLTTKGLTKRKLSPKGAAKLQGKVTVGAGNAKVDAAVAGEIAVATAGTRKLGLQTVQSLFNNILKVAAVTTGVFFAAAQYIDFANWQGPYQKTFQGLLAVFGLNPDTALPKSGAVSDDIWKRIYTVIEELKPIGISYPFSGVDRPYSRKNLADLVNEIAANMIKDGGDATFKNVMAVALPLIHLENGTRTDADVDRALAKGYPTGSVKQSYATTYTTPKVFTGVVSQGVVQQGLVFQERQDDLIESVEEMKTAAANNLVPFLRALPGRVVYELKVVSSVTLKDGFKQTGTTQQVQTGTYANGKPKYKTVTNKFAVLDVFAITDKGSRAKLQTIILGPTNTARLMVQPNDLRTLEQSLSGLVTTTDTKEILGIGSSEVGEPVENKNAGAGELDTSVADGSDTGYRFYSFTVNGEEYIEILPWVGNIPTGHTMLTRAEYIAKQNKMLADNPTRWRPFFEQITRGNPNAFTSGESGYIIKDGIPYFVGTASASGTGSAVNNGGSTGSNAGANATTLFDWYQSQGQSLPSLAIRAEKYQALGLGQKSYYTGTAEQNTKLLAALKNQ